jgi:hypothetical protein
MNRTISYQILTGPEAWREFITTIYWLEQARHVPNAYQVHDLKGSISVSNDAGH